MSLIYLITSLPSLKLGAKSTMTRSEFTRAARELLTGQDRSELELAFQIEEVETTTNLIQASKLGLESAIENLDEHQQSRRRDADREGRYLPAWIVKDRPHQLLMRYWYQCVRKRAHSSFLRDYARQNLNLEEMIAALICRQQDLDHSAFVAQMEGGFDSTWKMIMTRLDEPDMGISRRYSGYHHLRETLELEDFVQMEKRLNRLRWQIIDRCLSTELFSIDAVLAFYFRLRIIERESSWSEEQGSAILDQILQRSIKDSI